MKYKAISSIAILSSLLFSCQSTPEPAKTAPPKEVATKKVKAPVSAISTISPIKLNWEVRGYFTPDLTQKINIPAKAWKTFEMQSFKEEGTFVKKGEIIAQFKDDAIRKHIDFLQGELDSAVASFEQAKLNLRVDLLRSASSLEGAQLKAQRAAEQLEDYKNWKRDDEIVGAKMSVEDYATRLDYVKAEIEQLEKMYKEDDLTQESEEFILTKKRKLARDMEVFLKIRQRDLEVTLSRTIPDKLRALKNNKLEQDINLTKKIEEWRVWEIKQRANIENSRRDIDKKKKFLQKVQDDLKLFTIKAEFDGILYYGECHDGVWKGEYNTRETVKHKKNINANITYATLVDETQLSVTALFPEKHIRFIKEGMPTEMRSDTNNKIIFHGEITSHSRNQAKQQFYKLTSSFGNESDHAYIKPGMIARINVNYYYQKDAVQVPTTFLQREGDTTFVYTEGENGPIKTIVKTGQSAAGMTQITEGLKPSVRIFLKK